MNQQADQTVAEVVADELANAGVDRVFGLPGGEVLTLIEALRVRGIKFELCRHESNAGMMAAVYGKLMGFPGVIITTLGPGAANLLLPITNSLLDREPLLAISADIPSTWPVSHTHQRLPLRDIFRPVSKSVDALDPLNARLTIRRAIDTAMTEPLGPAYLTLSADDAMAPFLGSRTETAPESNGAYRALQVPLIGSDSARQVCEILSEAKRPMVLVGIGVRNSIAPELRTWLARWNLPVSVTPKAKGIVDESDDNFVGVIGGMSIDHLMLDALKKADVLIGFGFDPVEVDKTWHASLPITWVLESSQAGGQLPRQNIILTSHKMLLDELGAQNPPAVWDQPFADIQAERKRVYESDPISEYDPETVYPTTIVRTIAEVVPSNTIVTTDVGSHKYLFGQFWPSSKPGTFFMSNGLSGMGYGLPAAIGAKLARPESPVIAIVGDGGFSMFSQELETANRIGARVITIVLADRSYSMIRYAQRSRGLTQYGVDFNHIDSIQTAHACGIDGISVSNSNELSRAMTKALEMRENFVIEILVDLDAWRGLV